MSASAAVGSAPPTLRWPIVVCATSTCSFLKLNFIKNKKVIGHFYVKFDVLQLLLGTFFHIFCRLQIINDAFGGLFGLTDQPCPNVELTEIDNCSKHPIYNLHIKFQPLSIHCIYSLSRHI